MIYLPGRKIEDGVVNQINLRQDILGDTSVRKDTSSIHFFNQKMPWIKLTSSVNIEGSDLPARQNILSNGILPGEQGIIPGYTQSGNNLGIRPNPGIESMELETHNRYGSLRTATITFRVFDVDQLDLYERLYMSPGYSLLLEWGFSKYLDDNGNVRDINQTIDIFDGQLDFTVILSKILKLRASQGFCYDAMYGIVQNFSWRLLPDGSYECTTSIVSAGYLLESMEIPVYTDRELVERYIREKKEEDILDLTEGMVAVQDNTQLPSPVIIPPGQIPQVDTTVLTLLSGQLPPELQFESVEETTVVNETPTQESIPDEIYLTEIRRFHPEVRTNIHAFIYFALKEAREDAEDSVSDFYSTYNSSYIQNELSKRIEIQEDAHKVVAAKYMVVAGNKNNKENKQDKNYNYIQFGLLLDILNYFIVQFQKDTPIFKFDTSIIGDPQEKDFKTLDRYHFSVDPSICLLPDTDDISFPEKRPLLSNINPLNPFNTLQNQSQQVQSNRRSITSKIPNKITGILLEKDYIYNILDKFIQDGKLKIFQFVETILNDISRVSGLLNDFQIQYYQDLNLHRIVDRNYIDVDSGLPRLQIFGKNSFVKNVDLISRITPRLSTQLAIAAQANPFSNAIEASAWESFNRSLQDRVFVEKKGPRAAELAILDSVSDDQRQKRLESLFADIFRYLIIVYPSKTNKRLKSFTDVARYLGKLPPNIIGSYREFCNWHFNEEVKDGKRNNFILPYQLNLTLDGLSGINVMDSFLIDDFVIPNRYKGNGQIGFLVTGLKHKITPQRWDTEIISEIYNIDRSKTRGANTGKPDLSQVLIPGATTPTAPTTTTGAYPFTGPTPNGDLLRSVVTGLGYTERVLAQYSPVGEITSGGDISSTMSAVAQNVFGQIKQRLPGIDVQLTGGNDAYHQLNKPNSQHAQGNALDFTIVPYTTANSNEIKRIVQSSGGTFLDEYQIITQGRTGGHIHIAV